MSFRHEHDIQGQTILVTGGAGFIGSHIVDQLVEANEVRILDNCSTGRVENIPESATFIEGDIRDSRTLSRAIDGADLVFHEAAQVSVSRSVTSPQTSHDVNARATIQLLECARNEDARVVVASSAAIYGEPDRIPVSEEQHKTPSSPYGTEKLMLDHYARLYHELYSLPTVALRYFNVYGPRQTAGDYSGVISVFKDQAEAGKPITIEGNGKQSRDFVHVEDVVQANLLAATTDSVGEAYNIGTGERATISELATTFRDVVDSKSKIVHTDPRSGDVRHSCADISKAHDILNYRPSVSLAAGIEGLVT